MCLPLGYYTHCSTHREKPAVYKHLCQPETSIWVMQYRRGDLHSNVDILNTIGCMLYRQFHSRPFSPMKSKHAWLMHAKLNVYEVFHQIMMEKESQEEEASTNNLVIALYKANILIIVLRLSSYNGHTVLDWHF